MIAITAIGMLIHNKTNKLMLKKKNARMENNNKTTPPISSLLKANHTIANNTNHGIAFGALFNIPCKSLLSAPDSKAKVKIDIAKISKTPLAILTNVLNIQLIIAEKRLMKNRRFCEIVASTYHL